MTVIVTEDMITPILCPTPVCSGEEICYETPFDCSKYFWTISDEGGINGNTSDSIVCVEWVNENGSSTGALSLGVMNCIEEYCVYPTVVYIPLFPSVVDIAGPEMVCGDTFAIYTITNFGNATGINYLWNYQILEGTGGVMFNPLNKPTNTFSFQGFTGSILLSVTGMENMGTCSFEASKIINVYNSRIQLESPVCFGTDISVELIPAAEDPIDWFVYDQFNNEVYQSLMAGSSISIPSTVGLPTGNYTIAAMMPGGFPGACMVDTIFSVKDAISPPIITGPSVVCFESSHKYRSTINATHEWVVVGGEIIGPYDTREITILWNDTIAPHIIRVRRLEGGCYSDFATKEIQVQETGDLMIMGNTTPCPDNLQPEYYTISFDGASSITWQILPPYSHLGSLVQGDHPDSVSIYWHYAQVNGIQLSVTADVCNTTASDTLIINLQPYTPIYNWPDTVCQYALTHLELPDANDYKWYINGDLQVEETLQYLDHVFTEYGTYYITAILKDPGGCSGEYSILDSIFVSPAPLASIFLADPLPCPVGTPFDSIYLETLEYPGFTSVSYSWSHGGMEIGTGHEVMISDTGLYKLLVSIGNCIDSSSYHVNYDCEAECPCSSNVQVIIDTLYSFQGSCGLFRVEGSINPFLNDSNVVGARYIFPLPIGTVEVNEIGALVQTRSYDEPGIYHIKLQADWQCDTGVICKVTDIEPLRIPVISDFVWDFSCIGDGDEYLVTVRDASRAIDSLQVNNWSGDISPQTGMAAIQFQGVAGSSLEVCLTQTTLGGYSCIKCQMIDVPEAPSADFSISSPGICLNTEVQMIPNIFPSDYVANVLWDFGDNSISQIESPFKKYAAIGTYPINLTVETAFGCILTANDTFEVVSTVIDGEIEVLSANCQASDTLIFLLSSGGPIEKWEWSTLENDSIIVVTLSDIYTVTVTDENGCTFESTQAVQPLSPFPDSIIGNLFHCSSINLKVIAVGSYVYDWHVTGPGGFEDTKIGSLNYSKSNLNAGTYLVEVVASDTSGICSEMSVEVVIYGNPAPPVVTIDVANCMPSEVVLSADNVVFWRSGGFSATAQEIELTNYAGRTITARYTDENNCTSTTSTFIPQDIDFTSLGTGCGEACPDSILAGAVCLNGISGSFNYWEWRLNGVAIPGANGSDTVKCLFLDTSYLNKYITLLIENDSCEEESPLFYIKEIECPSTCPDSLIVEANTNDIMALFGDVDCDEYVYYVRGSYVIPQGYVFCDSIPVFEGGYFVYDEFLYSLNPSSNSVTFSGHLYVTDMVLYMSNPGLIGQFLICDASTGAVCPAKVTIQYRAPMLGMMCNFTHCLNCSPCNNTLGQNVPVKSCMTLQFPTCYDDCGINEYILNIIMPNDSGLLGPVIYSDTIVWDSMGISQEYCFEYSVKYRTIPCYYVQLTSNCGHSCLSSFCLNSLQTCNIIPIMPLKQGHNQFYLEQSELEIYPNPNNGDLIHLKAGNVTSGGAYLTIYSLDGGIVLKEDVSFSGQNASIQTSNLTQGTYVISVQDKVTGLRCTSRYVHMD
jgi:PKD repeat protein